MREIKLPQLGQSVEEAKITEWFKKEGDLVEKGEPLFTVETDKAEIDCEATASGTLRKILIDTDALIPVMTVVALIGDPGEDLPDLSIYALVDVATTFPPQAEASQLVNNDAIARNEPATLPVTGPVASPRASATAARLGVALDTVRGTGAGGRIMDIDVVAVASTTPETQNVDGVRIPLSPMRRTVARRMTESKFSAPHFYTTVEVDMSNAAAYREQSVNFKPSYNDLILAAVTGTLMLAPAVNARWIGDAIVQASRIHLGFAVALEDGLIVPVIRDAQSKTLRDIHDEAALLTEKAKSNKLMPDDYDGSTFTVSNLGAYGVDHFTAIINSPDSAILAVGMIQDRPVVEEGEVVVRPMVKLTLSSDHRVIDGAVAATFLRELKNALEKGAYKA